MTLFFVRSIEETETLSSPMAAGTDVVGAVTRRAVRGKVARGPAAVSCRIPRLNCLLCSDRESAPSKTTEELDNEMDTYMNDA